MGLVNSYAIWNNKGGVGKSTITFHLAMRYAELHPEKKILVIDLCPQFNSSMMLLGGGLEGEQKAIEYSTPDEPRTVVGYLSHTIASGRGASLADPMTYLVHVCDENDKAPENIYLLCGDGNLEPMAPAISEAALARALTANDKPWKWVQEIFLKFIEKLVRESDDEWMILIDTNPSFSIYTQIAISSAQRLLTPINADDSSKAAAAAMMALLHGTNPPHPIYGSWTYAEMAKTMQVNVPKLHLLIGNRLTQFSGPAKAYSALSTATSEVLFEIYQRHQEYFTSANGSCVLDHEEFIEQYLVPLRDFNTVGVVCAHGGDKLSNMRQGYYRLYGQDVKVNSERINDCIQAVDAIIDRI